MKQENAELTDQLASEYVLGTLHGGARRRFERWLRDDRSGVLHAQVDGWEVKLNKLAAESVPIEPPEKTWDELHKRLFAPQLAERGSWFRGARIWGNLTAASGLLAGILAVALWIGVPVSEPDYAGVLQNSNEKPVWTLTAQSELTHLRVRNNTPIEDLPADRGCLLWIQPAGSDEFVPIGLLPDDGSSKTLDIDMQLRARLAGAKLVVSVERKNSTLPAEPTGKIEFEGEMVARNERI